LPLLPRSRGTLAHILMTNLQKITILLIFLSFISCKKNEDEYLFEENRFENIGSLKLEKVIETEKKIGSKERTYNNVFELGNDYYRNVHNYILSLKVYERSQENLKLETDYFYTRNDSLVKVIFYEWSPKTDTLRKLKISEKKAFEDKITNLKSLISKKLGAPKVQKVDEYKWLLNNLAAELYYDADGSGFTRIRLAVYKM